LGEAMSFNISNYFFCVSIGLIAVLIFAIYRYIHREKLAASFLKLPDEKRETVLKLEKNILRLFQLALWPSLVLLIVFPLVMFFSFRESFLSSTVGMVLLVIVILQEYLFRKWLINYVESREIPK
jgi:hypothetical protein